MSRDTLSQQGDFPKGASKPAPGDMVQIIMTERMARVFEVMCLGLGNTIGDTHLVGPLLFSDDDLPTYTIGVGMNSVGGGR